MKEKPEHPFREDPLIDEVRAIRKAVCDSYGNEVERLWEHLQEIQRRHAGRLVSPPRGQPTSRGE